VDNKRKIMEKGQELLYKDECYKIVGACMEVHRILGCGFLEPVYQDALAIEFQHSRIPHEREKVFEIDYKGIVLPNTYKADFICYGQIIVELKALSQLTNDHTAQILNYLKASNLKVGLLINFGTQSLDHHRFIL
jgi:GxxExxY protein